MIELNPNGHPASEADPETAGTRVDWPALPAGAPSRDSIAQDAVSEDAVSPDALVGALLGRLSTLPDLPVAGHGEVYAGLHEDLMEALNEPVPGHSPAPSTAGESGS